MADIEASEPFAIVPSSRWAEWIEERLGDVEGRLPADLVDEPTVHERLDRHRAELEAIKRAINDLIDYLAHERPEDMPSQLQPAPVVTSSPEEYL